MKTPPLPKEALMTVTGLPFPLKAKGKVREVFDLGEHYLIVATDRLSAFDVVMPNGVPGKGILLTHISLWWFEQAKAVFPTHLVPDHAAALTSALKGHEHLIPRSMLVRKLVPLPVEAVVRGYLAGSGFKEYKKGGAILDHALPAGLLDGSKLPTPIFTPSTKAAEGHDEAITPSRKRRSNSFHVAPSSPMTTARAEVGAGRDRGSSKRLRCLTLPVTSV